MKDWVGIGIGLSVALALALLGFVIWVIIKLLQHFAII
jgi:hypothetical protein